MISPSIIRHTLTPSSINLHTYVASKIQEPCELHLPYISHLEISKSPSAQVRLPGGADYSHWLRPTIPQNRTCRPAQWLGCFFFFFRLIWLPVFSDSRLNFPDRVGTGGQSQSGSQRQLILNLAHLYLSSPAPTSSASSDSFTHPTIFHHNHSIILSPTTNFLSPPPST